MEVSLFEALGEWMSQPAHYTRYGGTPPPRVGTRHATIAPYGAYTAADGGQVLFSVQNEREWAALCERFLERPELLDDPRFATGSARVAHREELDAIIAERFRRTGADETMESLDAVGIANAGVNGVREFVAHPVLAERGRWHEVDTPGGVVEALRPPADLAGISPRMDPVPAGRRAHRADPDRTGARRRPDRRAARGRRDLTKPKGAHREHLGRPVPDERFVVETVRDFVDGEVKPAARELEHANAYPDKLIEQMKRLGIYGLAIPEEYGGNPVSVPCYVLVTEELARGWMSLGMRDGRPYRGRQTAAGIRYRRAEALLPAGNGHRRDPGHDGLTEPGGGSDLQAMRTHARGAPMATSSTGRRPGSATPGVPS